MPYKIWIATATFTPVYVSVEINGADPAYAIFRSRINSCFGTQTITGCDISINYYWQDEFANSSNSSVTIVAGNSDAQVLPNGNNLVFVSITSVFWTGGGGCIGYANTITAC
jgi:hypothetical protein